MAHTLFDLCDRVAVVLALPAEVVVLMWCWPASSAGGQLRFNAENPFTRYFCASVSAYDPF